MMFACQFDNNLFALLLFEGICYGNSKAKVYRYNELRSELVYRIELLQRAGLGAGTNELRRHLVKGSLCRHELIASYSRISVSTQHPKLSSSFLANKSELISIVSMYNNEFLQYCNYSVCLLCIVLCVCVCALCVLCVVCVCFVCVCV
jgi:hypothetical protein